MLRDLTTTPGAKLPKSLVESPPNESLCFSSGLLLQAVLPTAARGVLLGYKWDDDTPFPIEMNFKSKALRYYYIANQWLISGL